MVAQSAGFSYAEAGWAAGWERAVSRWPELPGRQVAVGGVRVSCADAAAALDALGASGGIMVRQVLQASGNPLKDCDYHAAAAPFLASWDGPGSYGRGASGRPVTKTAFMAALEDALGRAAAAEPARHFAAELAAASGAFSSDAGYAAAMARAAVALKARAGLQPGGSRVRAADSARAADSVAA